MDTLSFLQFVDVLSAPPGSYLVTIHIECLYNSIPHKLGLNTIRSFFEQKTQTNSLFDNFILQLLDFVLTHNTFLFDGQAYCQTQGVAMGTPCAPSYANLFLGAWEQEIYRVFVQTHLSYRYLFFISIFFQIFVYLVKL